MYYYLVGALKRRLISELRDSFGKHPVYQKIAPNIQNKFAFKERPQFGIVVKGSSANKVQLSADNFLGTVSSHVMLAYLGEPVYPVEWVREDIEVTRLYEGRMPTRPGVYYLEILTAPQKHGEVGTFVIDPLLTVNEEAVLLVRQGHENHAMLQNIPSPKTVRLWSNGRYLLAEGTDYQLSGAEITFLVSLPIGTQITADYRYAAESIGPVEFKWNSADAKTLPGVVIAFGKRAVARQVVAIVVYGDAVDTAKAYGGRFDASFDLDIIARDSDQMEELADLTVMYLWGERRNALSTEGIEITDVSMGGEAEEIADETGDDYFYQASVSVQIQSDWEMHVPIPFVVSQVTPDFQPVASDLFFATYPVLVRSRDFETIR